MRLLNPLLAAGLLGLATAGAATAETYRASTWLPDNEATVVIQFWFSKELAKASNGAIEFENFTSGVLMPPKAHLKGIGDGVVQEGFHTSGYTPSEVPIANALAGFGFVESDPITIGAAWADFVMHDKEQNAEFLGHNVVPVGGFSTPTYPIICNTAEPITELDQMKGLKVRSIGLLGKLVQDLGGVSVNIPAPEIYQALQTGQIDCAGIFPSYLNIDNSLEEVSKSVTLMEWSGSYNSPLQLYNKDFWEGLTDEQRKTIFELAARAQARLQIHYNNFQQKALDDAEANGHKIVQPADSIKVAVQEWVDNGVGDMAGVAHDTFGVEDPEALFSRFRPYIEKWQGLIGGLENKYDEEALTKVLQDNLYNDIDPSSYGMN